MGIGSILKHDPVVQLLTGGDRGHGVPGNGNGHVQLSFPMSPGDTVNTIAEKLGLPIDSLLQANPGMSANTPLTAGLTVQLPVSNPGGLHGGWNEGNGRVDDGVPPGQRELPLPPDLPNPMRARIDGIQLGVTLSAGPNAPQTLPLVAAATLNAGDAAFQAARGQPLAGWPGGTAPGSAPASFVPAADRGGTVATALPASSLGAARADGVVLSFAQAAGALAQAMNAQRGNESVPPPPPMPWLDGTRPNLVATPLFWPGGAPAGTPAGWAVAAPAVDGNEAKLQIMALLMAQLGQAAAGSAGAANVQAPGFIDPQAVAAHAASMRAGRTIDLGAGRSLQFTLVQDRMRRIGAIGDEERAMAGRRARDAATKAARERRAENDETEEGRDRREQARRRRAAEAAMRRRRRKLSARCRPRRGPRLPLRAPGQGRYPASIDWAEFRGRLPPRYLWGTPPPETPSP